MNVISVFHGRARQIVLLSTAKAFVLFILFGQHIVVCVIYLQLHKHNAKPLKQRFTFSNQYRGISKIPTGSRSFDFSDSRVWIRSLRALFSPSRELFCSLACCSFILSEEIRP